MSDPGGTETDESRRFAENERIQHEHSDVTGGWLRPAVFGASDGLVSNFALIAGVAAGTSNPKVVLLAGIAGLAAGAFSMAAGEYISVRSQAEQALAEIEKERSEIEQRPHAEQRELAAMYEAKGLEPDLARQVAQQLSRDPAVALGVHVREELGFDPGALPSASLAAGSSFVSFGVGAALPVLPYVLGATGLWPAIVLTLLGLFLCGALVTRLTPRPWWYGGARQALIGALAAAVTYGIGSVVNVGIS
ncbi:MAG: vacuolar iron transporter family protein [Actinomycetota bacterium]|nr:vacuolar iron transporter family protein [Actinomycetota bacterium]MDQ1642988.1 vacuolar iron transporter family protein [Actinomycetota bacterium]